MRAIFISFMSYEITTSPPPPSPPTSHAPFLEFGGFLLCCLSNSGVGEVEVYSMIICLYYIPSIDTIKIDNICLVSSGGLAHGLIITKESLKRDSPMQTCLNHEYSSVSAGLPTRNTSLLIDEKKCTAL